MEIKTKSRTQNASLNIIFSILMQLVAAISGLILPRLIIPTYGSDINGLIASITQFLSYISLLDAGVGGIFRASLYKPLAERDMTGVSGIINAQKHFYRKIGIAFVAYVGIFCVTFPFFAQTELDRGLIVLMILVLSLGTFFEYFFSLPYQSLISADQKVRLIYIASIATTVVNFIIVYVMVQLHANILAIKLVGCGIAVVKPFFFVLYVKKHYSLDKTTQMDNRALSQRWNGMIHHFAFFIHNNTDIALLTVFVGTAQVSVYAVYYAIVAGIEKIITSISAGSGAGIGHMLVSDNKNNIDKTVDTFEFVQVVTTAFFYTVTAITLMPFISFYTKSMVDAEYYQPVFGYLLILAEAIYCICCVFSTVSMGANKFKETQWGALGECVINVAVSVVLLIVFPPEWKLVAVAVGTVCGMLFRLVFEVVYLSRAVINRPIRKACRTVFLYSIASALSIVTCWLALHFTITNFWEWALYAIVVSAITMGYMALITLLFNRDVGRKAVKKVFSILKR